MSDHPSSRDSSEVIRPVRLDDVSPLITKAPPPPGGGWGAAVALALAAVAGLLGLLWYFTLPPSDPLTPAPATTPVEPAPPVPTPAPIKAPAPAAPTATTQPSTPSAADMARQEAEKVVAEKAMEEWSILHGHLKEHGVTLWGGDGYGGALATARQGDQALVGKAFLDAAARYREATAALAELNGVTNLVFHQWIDEAETLAANREAEAAKAKIEALEQMAPGSPAVAQARATVEQALRVAERMGAGAAHEKAGRWAQAFVEYQEAATLDPAHPAAAEALERARMTLSDQEFRGLMTAGFAALRKPDFDAAEKQFGKARDLRPESPEIRDALQQVVEGRRNARIEMLKGEATAAEAAEDWDLAFTKHGEALNVDAGLVFAQAGRERAQKLAQAMKRMAFFVNDPRALQSDRGLEEGRTALAEGQALTAGPRLAAMVADLSAKLAAASAKTTVTLKSDGATRIAIFKHGQFEPFTEKSIELRPGTWTVTGIRPGYRDVRLTLEIAIGDTAKTLTVACTEKVR